MTIDLQSKILQAGKNYSNSLSSGILVIAYHKNMNIFSFKTFNGSTHNYKFSYTKKSQNNKLINLTSY